MVKLYESKSSVNDNASESSSLETHKEIPISSILYESNTKGKQVSMSMCEQEANTMNIAKFVAIMGFTYASMKTSDYGGVFLDFMSATYGWYDVGGDDTTVRSQHNLQLSTVSLIGQMLGSIMASRLMQLGRKRVIICTVILANIFCIPCLILNYNLFITMRAGLALCLGVFYASAARYIEEYLPLKVHGVSWATIQTMAQFGILETISLSFMFPQTNNEITQQQVDELAATPTWWVIPAQPIVLLTISLVLLCFLDEPPKYLIANGKNDQAIQVIHKIYQTDGDDSVAQSISCFIASNGTKVTDKISFKEAFFTDQNHRRASWVAIFVMFFHVFTGDNLIRYIFPILVEDLLPNAGHWGMVGFDIFAFVSIMCSIITIKYFGRRTLLLTGHSIIAIIMFLVGISYSFNYNYATFVLVCLETVVYNLTTYQCASLLIAEISCDTALGPAFGTLFFSIILGNTLWTKVLEPTLGDDYSFFVYGSISLIGVIFIYICVPETKGLTEKEKKEILRPGGQYGRKLTATEQAIRGIDRFSETTPIISQIDQQKPGDCTPTKN